MADNEFDKQRDIEAEGQRAALYHNKTRSWPRGGRIECRNCVRTVYKRTEVLCDWCLAFNNYEAKRKALQQFMSDEAIDALLEFLEAKQEHDKQ